MAPTKDEKPDEKDAQPEGPQHQPVQHPGAEPEKPVRRTADDQGEPAAPEQADATTRREDAAEALSVAQAAQAELDALPDPDEPKDASGVGIESGVDWGDTIERQRQADKRREVQGRMTRGDARTAIDVLVSSHTQPVQVSRAWLEGARKDGTISRERQTEFEHAVERGKIRVGDR